MVDRALVHLHAQQFFYERSGNTVRTAWAPEVRPATPGGRMRRLFGKIEGGEFVVEPTTAQRVEPQGEHAQRVSANPQQRSRPQDFGEPLKDVRGECLLLEEMWLLRIDIPT